MVRLDHRRFATGAPLSRDRSTAAPRSERHLAQQMDWEKISDKLSAFGERTGKTMRRMFGSANERMVRKLEPEVARINELESWAQGLSADQFKEQTAEWKRQVAEGEVELDDLLPDAFALVREASVRTLGLRHYDVQLVGGIILHQGAIAEMKTGEGKTLVATLALYLNSLSGRTSFLVTVNDYLAKRDAQWMGPIYDYLGCSWGYIQSQMDPNGRHPVYASDIVYATNNELGFDYLRDNMKTRLEDQVQRNLYFAIVDEVDSILIDEARTPLIISGPADLMPQKYAQADKVARALDPEEHYEVKEKERQVSLLEDGIVRAQELLGVESFYDPGHMDWPHYIENALRAHNLYEKDKEYVVENGEVIIVDEFTGRKMTGRRWSDGLHQAVETKEGLPIRAENQTLATITFQNYFRLFEKLSGMTGTAETEAEEFHKIYDMAVMSVPTNLPIARDDASDVVYRTEPEKWKALVDEISEVHERGQPLLVGTTSIENSEKLSALLDEAGIPHNVLNAKNHEREAQIVARAGEKGAVTVATNMAGRGTDIKLGGNFEYRLGLALEEAGLTLGDEEHLEEIARVRDQVREVTDRDEAEVLELGGLYVLGTERHEARRIDNQLRGRSGRQGDAGVSRFFLSLEDPLMRRFYREGVKNMMARLGMTEGVAIESPMVSRAIKKAQKKVEDMHFEVRKNLLEYDEVMDEQRKTVYGVRQEALEGADLSERVREMIESVVLRNADVFDQDPEGFMGWYQRAFGVELDADIARVATDGRDKNPQGAVDAVLARYAEREEEITSDLMRQVERFLMLRTMDSRWKDHLHAVDALKAGIGLRGYAQRDPKSEYKQEGFELFQNFLRAVEDEVSSLILRVQVGRPGEAAPQAPQQQMGTAHHPSPGGQQTPAPRRVVRRRAGGLPASGAFDQMKRVEAIRAAQQAALDRQRSGDGAGPGAGSGESPPKQPAAPAPAPAPKQAAATTAPEEVAEVGRNDPCPCGSGLKYKKCHGRGK